MVVHVSLVPVIGVVGEQKTKPTQHSVATLRSLGLNPALLACRSSEPLQDSVREKLVGGGGGGGGGWGPWEEAQAAVELRTEAAHCWAFRCSSRCTQGCRVARWVPWRRLWVACRDCGSWNLQPTGPCCRVLVPPSPSAGVLLPRASGTGAHHARRQQHLARASHDAGTGGIQGSFAWWPAMSFPAGQRGRLQRNATPKRRGVHGALNRSAQPVPPLAPAGRARDHLPAAGPGWRQQDRHLPLEAAHRRQVGQADRRERQPRGALAVPKACMCLAACDCHARVTYGSCPALPCFMDGQEETAEALLSNSGGVAASKASPHLSARPCLPNRAPMAPCPSHAQPSPCPTRPCSPAGGCDCHGGQVH